MYIFVSLTAGFSYFVITPSAIIIKDCCNEYVTQVNIPMSNITIWYTLASCQILYISSLHILEGKIVGAQSKLTLFFLSKKMICIIIWMKIASWSSTALLWKLFIYCQIHLRYLWNKTDSLQYSVNSLRYQDSFWCAAHDCQCQSITRYITQESQTIIWYGRWRKRYHVFMAVGIHMYIHEFVV